MTECILTLLPTVLLSVALLASLSLNLICCLLRHKRSSQKDQNTSRNGKSLPQIEEAHPGDTNNYTPEENSCSHSLLQENPIYGNIITDGRGSVVYEAMIVRPRDRAKPLESDLNYASLDLKIDMKRRRKQHGCVPGQISPSNQRWLRLTPPESAFLDEACLPLGDQSPMVSQSSIYLNSQQLNLDNEDMNWQTAGEERTEEWCPEQESEDNVCCEDGN